MQTLSQNPATQDVPVVFYSLPTAKIEGAILAIDYLTKPISNADMARALERQGFGPESATRRTRSFSLTTI